MGVQPLAGIPEGPLQQQWMVEDVDWFTAAGTDAAALDGVHLDGDDVVEFVPDVGAAGGSGQLQAERVGVGGGPFGDDVGHDATVVVGGRQDVTVDGSAEVNAVHPYIAGEADVVKGSRPASTSSAQA